MRRRNKRQRILIWIISLIIVASMVCGFVAQLSPGSSSALFDGSALASVSGLLAIL